MNFINKEELEKRKNEAAVDQIVLDHMVTLNTMLTYTEAEYKDIFPNIFIFGLPRSGTTLLSQIVAATTNLGYINNLIARFWENPQYGVYLSRSLCLPREISFESLHAVTKKITDVHEFGYFWASLLHHTSSPRLGENEGEMIDWNLLKNKVLSINHAFNSGVVYKNTLVGHYTRLFSHTFAHPFFLYIKRNKLDVAYSILTARKRRYGSIHEWWSMKPFEYDAIKDLDPYEQVAAQMYYLEKDYEGQVKGLDQSRVLTIDYETLCHDPWSCLDELQGALEPYDLGTIRRELPLHYSSHRTTQDRDVDILKQALNNYFTT